MGPLDQAGEQGGCGNKLNKIEKEEQEGEEGYVAMLWDSKPLKTNCSYMFCR